MNQLGIPVFSGYRSVVMPIQITDVPIMILGMRSFFPSSCVTNPTTVHHPRIDAGFLAFFSAGVCNEKLETLKQRYRP